MSSATARTAQHVAEEKRRKDFRDLFCKTVLMGTHDNDSPLSKLVALPEVQKKMYEFALPTPLEERLFFYKIQLVTCSGTEGVHVEALNYPNPNIRNHPRFADRGFGSLSNNLICGSSWFLTKPFLREHANSKNEEDGSFLNEGQLRALWKTYNLTHGCDSPLGRCKGVCGALPGDTVFWKSSYMGSESYKYSPATQEDIVERGYFECGPGGLLVAQARIAREDPSQLESDNEE